MIFAELDYNGHYDHHHAPVLALLRSAFRQVEAGHQCDSWIWVLDGGEKVAVDTFTAMRHQVKSATSGPHVQRVIAALQASYSITIHEPPVPEAHEDG